MKSMKNIMQKKRIQFLFITVLLIINISGCSYINTVRLSSEHDEDNSADAAYHYSLGILFRLEGKIEEAIVELEKAHKFDPGSYYLITELVSLYTEKGDFERAISLGEKQLSRDQNNIDLHLIMGGLYLNLREYKKAIREHEKVVELDPKNMVAYLYLAIIYATENNFVKAEENFNKIL